MQSGSQQQGIPSGALWHVPVRPLAHGQLISLLVAIVLFWQSESQGQGLPEPSSITLHVSLTVLHGQTSSAIALGRVSINANAKNKKVFLNMDFIN
jgi:hypothetical protein